jgi:hypothetical protein
MNLKERKESQRGRIGEVQENMFKRSHRMKTKDTPLGSSCVENTKTHHKWAPLIKKTINPTMIIKMFFNTKTHHKGTPLIRKEVNPTMIIEMLKVITLMYGQKRC